MIVIVSDLLGSAPPITGPLQQAPDRLDMASEVGDLSLIHI